MLDLLTVQLLAGVSLAVLVGGFLLNHGPRHPSRGVDRVVAKSQPARWTEVVWAGAALLSSLWPIGVLLTPTYAYHWPASPDFPEAGVIQLVGFLVAVAGGLLFFSALRALGRHMTPAIQVREGQPLIQDGPYRHIRHPAYTAIVTAAAGASVLYLSPLLGLIALALAGVAIYRAHVEEALLRSPAAFGATYTAYVARTGRFLPRICSRR